MEGNPQFEKRECVAKSPQVTIALSQSHSLPPPGVCTPNPNTLHLQVILTAEASQIVACNHGFHWPYWHFGVVCPPEGFVSVFLFSRLSFSLFQTSIVYELPRAYINGGSQFMKFVDFQLHFPHMSSTIEIDRFSLILSFIWRLSTFSQKSIAWQRSLLLL